MTATMTSAPVSFALTKPNAPRYLPFVAAKTPVRASTPPTAPRLAFTRWGAFPVTQSGEFTIVADPYGIAWGEGHTVDEALEDWEIAAREIAALLANHDIVPELEGRRSVLRHWFG